MTTETGKSCAATRNELYSIFNENIEDLRGFFSKGGLSRLRAEAIREMNAVEAYVTYKVSTGSTKG